MRYTSRFQVEGIVEQIGKVQTFSSGFTKREIIVNTNGERPAPVALVLLKEDCAKGDQIKVGDEVSCEGFVNGRRWDGPNGVRYFTDLQVRSVIKRGGAAAAKPPAQATADEEEPMPF